MSEAAAAKSDPAPAGQEWVGDRPSALSAIWASCAVLRAKADVIAARMKVRRKQVLEKAEELVKVTQFLVSELEENKFVGPSHACKGFASAGYLIPELLKIGVEDEAEFNRLRDETMAGMSSRRLIFEIELVDNADKDLMVAGWKQAFEDLVALRDLLKA